MCIAGARSRLCFGLGIHNLAAEVEIVMTAGLQPILHLFIHVPSAKICLRGEPGVVAHTQSGGKIL